jgi:hypothetical protein
MKSDPMVTVLNIVLAVLVIFGVIFALLAMSRVRDLRQMQAPLQAEIQKSQITSARAQALLNDVIAFNASAKNQELAQIIQSAETPRTPAK